MPTPPWLSSLLHDPLITDICLNSVDSVYIDRGQGLEPLHAENSAFLKEEDLKTWVLDQISSAGKSWDARFPFIDASLDSGHRLHVAFPPLARQGILVSLRKIPEGTRPGESQVGVRWKDSPLFPTLLEIVRSGETLIISGATGSGKTTLASDLLEGVPQGERIIALEDTPELRPSHPHFLSLTSRGANADGFGEVPLRMLLRQTLRMRPDRIVLGECRGPEVLELLQALNTGHRGALATLHANSARDALRRIELLCLLSAGSAIAGTTIRELLAVGIQWICQVRRLGPLRSISELHRIEGREGDTILMRPVVIDPHDGHRPTHAPHSRAVSLERFPRSLVSQAE